MNQGNAVCRLLGTLIYYISTAHTWGKCLCGSARAKIWFLRIFPDFLEARSFFRTPNVWKPMLDHFSRHQTDQNANFRSRHATADFDKFWSSLTQYYQGSCYCLGLKSSARPRGWALLISSWLNLVSLPSCTLSTDSVLSSSVWGTTPFTHVPSLSISLSASLSLHSHTSLISHHSWFWLSLCSMMVPSWPSPLIMCFPIWHLIHGIWLRSSAYGIYLTASTWVVIPSLT